MKDRAQHAPEKKTILKYSRARSPSADRFQETRLPNPPSAPSWRRALGNQAIARFFSLTISGTPKPAGTTTTVKCGP